MAGQREPSREISGKSRKRGLWEKDFPGGEHSEEGERKEEKETTRERKQEGNKERTVEV